MMKENGRSQNWFLETTTICMTLPKKFRMPLSDWVQTAFVRQRSTVFSPIQCRSSRSQCCWQWYDSCSTERTCGQERLAGVQHWAWANLSICKTQPYWERYYHVQRRRGLLSQTQPQNRGGFQTLNKIWSSCSNSYRIWIWQRLSWLFHPYWRAAPILILLVSFVPIDAPISIGTIFGAKSCARILAQGSDCQDSGAILASFEVPGENSKIINILWSHPSWIHYWQRPTPALGMGYLSTILGC